MCGGVGWGGGGGGEVGGILRPINPSPHCSFPALWEALMLRPIDYDCDADHDCYSDE